MTGGKDHKRLAQRLIEDARKARARSAQLQTRATELAVLARAVGFPSGRIRARADSHVPSRPGSQCQAGAPSREPAPHDITVMEDRDRIAAELQANVIPRVFTSGLTLQGTVALTAQPEVRRRILAAVDELDQVIRAIRDAVFHVEHRLPGRGFAQEILAFSGQQAPALEVSFSSPVDAAVSPETAAQLHEVLRPALGLISEHAALARIDVKSGDSTYVIVIEAAPLSQAAGATGPVDVFSRLRDKAALAGIRMDIQPVARGTRFTWHVPLTSRPRPGHGESGSPHWPGNHASHAD